MKVQRPTQPAEALPLVQARMLRLVLQQLAPVTAAIRAAGLPAGGEGSQGRTAPDPHHAAASSACPGAGGQHRRLVACLGEVLAGASHHLLSEAASPGFLAMTAGLADCSPPGCQSGVWHNTRFTTCMHPPWFKGSASLESGITHDAGHACIGRATS